MLLCCMMVVSWCIQHAASGRCNTLFDSYSKCQAEEIVAKASLESTGPLIAFEAIGTNSDTGDMHLQNVVINVGDGYNQSVGEFTAPASGTYLMSFTTIPVCIKFEENKKSTCFLRQYQYGQSFGEHTKSIGEISNADLYSEYSTDLDSPKRDYKLKFNYSKPDDIFVTLPIFMKKGDSVSVFNCSEPYSYASWRGLLMQQTD